MYQSSTEKERLLLALTNIFDQLEELDLVLEKSFSDLRIRMNEEEQNKIFDSVKKLSILENKIDQTIPKSSGMIADFNLSDASKVLELELGF
ncbi:hypothetical protein HPT25_24745 [Bacillus sp. BRMEA1]|uniref:hypothetical protein n=1 Tax=Neobacillus endophyticus TaxID=2738405 RepID=UPI001566F2D9|nr:hypothetical protein [Neobacillus endophyticus]NRD80535.1 hypothetical protein [Neobacillus endophyticus]